MNKGRLIINFDEESIEVEGDNEDMNAHDVLMIIANIILMHLNKDKQEND